MSDKKFFISSSPHFSEGFNTQKVMMAVLIALLPECIYGVIIYGLQALITILVSIAGAIGFEALFQKITKQKIVISNLSAAVSGVLLALVLPPATPFWMVLIGDLVAVVIAKGLFGGIGSNVFNPALTGRAFLFISFPAVIGAKWTFPANAIDAVSSATVLNQIKAGTISADSNTILQLLYGNQGGCIGETSALLIILSFAFLAATHVIDWRAPVTMIGTVVFCSFISGLTGGNGLAGAGNEILLSLLSGGLLFGATFMVTDYATAPITKPGRLIFGFGCGLITFLIRKFGGYPEGVMFSILIMNAVAPHLNNLTYRMYGYGKRR